MNAKWWALGILFLAGSLLGQWTRRADIQGNITDVAIAPNQTPYVATDGAGVWAWTGAQWEERDGGIPDLRIRTIAVKPDDSNYIKAATASGYVFTSTDGGQSWIPDSGGLESIPDSYIPTDMVMVWDQNAGTWYTYLATLGAGVLRQAGLNGTWSAYNNGIDNKDVLSIGAVTQGTAPGARHMAICGARFTDDGQHPSRIFVLYTYSNLWMTVTSFTPSLSTDTSFPSIAFHDLEVALVGTSVDGFGQGQGVYYTTSASSYGSWTRVCSNPPNQTFFAVDYFKQISGQYLINGGTPSGLWKIDDPSHCSSPLPNYVPFSGFRGKVRALGIIDSASGIAGGPGKGPIRFIPNLPSGLVSNRRTGMSDTNILDISPSTYFGQIGDSTIFTASGIAGIYKNVDPIDCTGTQGVGYFYRMIGDPDSWGTVPVLKVRPVPGYGENACAPFKTVYAATAGQGILRSLDGGRSWSTVNGQANFLADAWVSDIAFSPSYNGSTNQTLYAAVYGKGVYQSTDGGNNWYLLGAIPNPNVLCLAIGTDNILFVGCRATNANPHGFYKWVPSDWSTAGGTSMDGKSVCVIGLPTAYPSPPWVFVGTENAGVWLSTNSGNTFGSKNVNLPSNARIYDLKLAPYYSTTGSTNVLIAVEPTTLLNGGVYGTNMGKAWAWNRIVGGLPTDDKILSVAFAPTFWSNSGQIFCGHATQGLFTGRLTDVGLDCAWTPASGFFNVPPGIRGMAVAPDDPTLVFAASEKDGVFISRDAGDTFQPWGAGLVYDGGSAMCAVHTTLSVAVSATFVPSGNLYLAEDFSAGIPGTWTVVNGGSAWSWMSSASDPCPRSIGSPLSAPYAILDSDCEGNGNTQADYLFTPSLDTSGARILNLEFDHYFQYYAGGGDDHGSIYIYSSGTGYTWIQIADFTGSNFGPEHVSLDITPYRGSSFYIAFYYVGAWDWYWAVDNVWVGEPVRRVVVGTADHGIYTATYNDGAHFGLFSPSNVTSGTVNEIRYAGLSEDLRAADPTAGDYHSSDLGMNWSLVPGIPPGTGLTDLSYAAGTLFASALPGGRGLTNFTWGCSSGKTASMRSGGCSSKGGAWYYNPAFGFWSACPTSGLDICEDYRSILKLNTGAVLLGSIAIGGGASGWKGLYRSEDNCSTWKTSHEGLPANPMVYAFYQNTDPADRFILASVVDSDAALPDNGGVYYSDASSSGHAWVKTDLPSSTPSSYDLASTGDGSTVYTGLASDGTFSTIPSTITLTGSPTAYFTPAEACVNTLVQFYDYSAGKVTGWTWAFGDGGTSTLQNPVHVYASTGEYYNVLKASNGAGPGHEDYYPEVTQTPLKVKSRLDVGSTLRAAKINPSTVNISWADLGDQETGYQVWASHSPAIGSTVGLPLGPDVVGTTLSGYEYFRIQPLSASHVCGNGVVGGAW